LYPTTLEALAFQERATLCCGAAAPVPLRASARDALDALLLNDPLAAAIPLAWGANLMVNDALWPAVRVSGNESPLMVNSEVLMLALETVMLDPVAVIEPVRLLLCPTVTLPKLRVAGLTASWPGTVGVPAKVMVSVELEASEVTTMDPEALAPEVGLNAAPKVKLWPGLRVIGRFNPVTLKPVPG
jgi:hypothetical protein